MCATQTHLIFCARSDFAPSKSASYGIWIPSLSRALVLQARGVHFSNMGHSARREVLSEPLQNADSPQKKPSNSRLELLPEEALYLVERGSMFCYKQEGSDPEDMYPDGPVEPGDANVHGTPMSVQQAFADMIGKEDLTLERYQVCLYFAEDYKLSLTDLLGLRVSQTPWILVHASHGAPVVSLLPPSSCTDLTRSSNRAGIINETCNSSCCKFLQKNYFCFPGQN